MSDWVLGQINVGTARYDLDDPRMDGFMSRLDAVNAIAEKSPGFVWRLQSGQGNATDIVLRPDEPRFIVNMSVWRDFESFEAYVFSEPHLSIMKDRRSWFEKHDGSPYACMWWQPADAPMPTGEEGLERLALLAEKGPTPAAFPFKKRFAAPRRGTIQSEE